MQSNMLANPEISSSKEFSDRTLREKSGSDENVFYSEKHTQEQNLEILNTEGFS